MIRLRAWVLVALASLLLVPSVAWARPGSGPAKPNVPPVGFKLPAHLENRFDLLLPEDIAEMKQRPEGLVTASAGNCYPSGHDGFHSACVNPNFTTTSSSSTFYHWADTDTSETGRSRPVWIVDEIEGGRATDWIKWVVADLMATWSGTGQPWRPQFYYFTGSALRAQFPGFGFSDCQNGWSYVVEFCVRTDLPEGSASKADWWWYGSGSSRAGHAYEADARISTWRTGTFNGITVDDLDINYAILHEFGHAALGLSHTDECASPMTYCSTAGNQYLFYTGTDKYVMSYLYDQNHPPAQL